MFCNYSANANNQNWVHESIVSAIESIIEIVNSGNEYPVWPDIIPAEYRNRFQRKRKIRDLFAEFYVISVQPVFSVDDLQSFLNLLEQQNQITGLLNGTVHLPALLPAAQPLYKKADEIFEEGFFLLAKTGVRDSHYETIYNSLPQKTCPFCGYETLEAPGLSREDYDHYLLRSTYALAAANLHNLSPMGSKCNKNYKGQKDIIARNGVRHRALDPYGTFSADISLENSILFPGGSVKPDWVINLVPDNEETQNWADVFEIETRLRKSVLEPIYGTVLDEVRTWFRLKGIFNDANDVVVIDALVGLVTYKRDNREQGLGFLKHKVVEVFVDCYRNGDVVLIAMIRDAMQAPK